MDAIKLAISLDRFINSYTKVLNALVVSKWNYGRGLEQASGLAFWFIAYTVLFSSAHGIQLETLQVNNFFVAWCLAVIGFCQLYYTGRPQRIVFNFFSTSIWLTISISSYLHFGDWNLLTAISLPYCLSIFYVFGFLLGPEDEE